MNHLHDVRRRGVTLLLSIAVLAVLSLLSISFVKLAAMERDAARNYSLSRKARQLAEGGIERAVGELARLTYTRSHSDFGSDSWIFRSDNGLAAGTYPATSLELSKYPSFPYDADEDGTFENGVVGGSSDDLVDGEAVSGVIADISDSAQTTYGLAGGQDWGQTAQGISRLTYKLRVRDANSKLNLNGTQANLATLINTLGASIATDIGVSDPVAGRGAAILTARAALEGGRFNDWHELEAVLSTEETLILREFVTLNGWVDATTVKPSPSIDPSVMPTVEIEARSPININTATKPVLRTLLVGLRGYAFRFVEGADVFMGSATVIDEKEATAAITDTQAGLIADRLIADRATSPFRTWSQFHDWVDGLRTVSGLTTLTTDQLDVLKANFNPNARVQRFNPNNVRAATIDKFDLLHHTCEFCFGSNGVFEIECLGRIYGPNSRLIARAEIDTVVEVASFVRHTSQVQFETNKVSNSRTVTYPESIADLIGNGDPADDLGTWADGQIEALRPLSSAGETLFAPFTDTLAGTLGLGTPVWDGNPKEEGVSVFAGSDLLPDGMLSSRSAAEELGYASDGNISPGAGTIQFWVKLKGDGSTGSNESLIYVVDTLVDGSQKQGVAHKFIRWGDQLISSRFYWGAPAGSTSTYPLSLSECIAEIGSWKAGEWHHLAIVWYEGVNHDLYVDGVRVTDKTTYTRNQIRFRLGSNAPGNEFTIGGYEYYSPEAVEIFNRGTVIVEGDNYRFSNSTIRDVRTYSTPLYTGASFATPEAFDANPAFPSVWTGKFTISRNFSLTLGALSWTEYQPKVWRTSTFNGDPTSPDTDIQVEYKIGDDPWVTVPTAPASGGDGRGVNIERHLGTTVGSDAVDVQYRLTFLNPGGISPYNVTPVLDDITLAFRRPPRFLRWTVR